MEIDEFQDQRITADHAEYDTAPPSGTAPSTPAGGKLRGVSSAAMQCRPLCAIVLATCVWAETVPRTQPRSLPVLDMHLHALPVDAQGPPPVGVCMGLAGMPAWDQRSAWPEQFFAWMRKDPIWSPATDEGLREETIAALNRLNIIGVLSGTPERVARWRQDAPDRLIAGLGFQITRDALTPDDVKALHSSGQLAVFAEVTNQYAGIAAEDPRFVPDLALTEALDIPVGIHIGTGPPGAANLFPTYRAASQRTAARRAATETPQTACLRDACWMAVARRHAGAAMGASSGVRRSRRDRVGAP
jgi:hypothetical protein